jgi:hypothetical protein
LRDGKGRGGEEEYGADVSHGGRLDLILAAWEQETVAGYRVSGNSQMKTGKGIPRNQA